MSVGWFLVGLWGLVALPSATIADGTDNLNFPKERAAAQTGSAIASIISIPTPTSPAIIQAVEFDQASNRLLIRSTEQLAFTSRWRGGAYQILVSPAQLAERLALPRVPATVMQLQMRQEAEQTVLIEMRLAVGVRIQQVSQVNPQSVWVQFQPIR